eukprot:g18836.t1
MYAVGGAAGGGPRGATLREGADGDILGGPAEYRSANQFLPPSRVAGPSGYADYREGGRIVSTLRAEQPQFGAAKARGGTPVGPSSAAGGAGAILDDGGMEFEVERFLSLSSLELQHTAGGAALRTSADALRSARVAAGVASTVAPAVPLSDAALYHVPLPPLVCRLNARRDAGPKTKQPAAVQHAGRQLGTGAAVDRAHLTLQAVRNVVEADVE